MNKMEKMFFLIVLISFLCGCAKKEIGDVTQLPVDEQIVHYKRQLKQLKADEEEDYFKKEILVKQEILEHFTKSREEMNIRKIQVAESLKELRQFEKDRSKIRSQKADSLDKQLKNQYLEYYKDIEKYKLEKRQNLEEETSRVQEEYLAKREEEAEKLRERGEQLDYLLEVKKSEIENNATAMVLNAQIQSEQLRIAQIENTVTRLNNTLNTFKMKNLVPRTTSEEVFKRMREVSDYYYSERYYDAIISCRKTLELMPDLYIAWVQLGTIYYRLGYNKTALEAYTKASEINSEDQELANITNVLKEIVN